MKCENLSEALLYITEKHGRKRLLDKSCIIGCLVDYFPNGKAERQILESAFALGIPAKLVKAARKDTIEQDIVILRSISQLNSNFGIDMEVAEDILQIYGEALGFEKCYTV